MARGVVMLTRGAGMGTVREVVSTAMSLVMWKERIGFFDVRIRLLGSLLCLGAVGLGGCIAPRSGSVFVPHRGVDQVWQSVDPAVALQCANELIASDKSSEKWQGYALRSVLRFDGSDEYMCLTVSMCYSYWLVVLPFGVVYDLLRLPVQLWNGMNICHEDMVSASRDIDAARRLGLASEDGEERGMLLLFGRYYVPIDMTSFYVPENVVK